MTDSDRSADPVKLLLPEIAAMRPRHQPIVMVTAYDAPSARLADRGGRRHDSRRRLGRHDRARRDVDRARHDGRHAGLHARGGPRHARARSSSPTCRSGPISLRRRRGRQRHPPREGRRRRRREARRRRAAPSRASAASSMPAFRSWATSASRRSRRRCSAAIARRAARPTAAERLVRRSRRARARGLLRDRARGDARDRRRAGDRRRRHSDDRHRRRRRLQRARCWCGTTCSAFPSEPLPRFVKQYAVARRCHRTGAARVRARCPAGHVSRRASHLRDARGRTRASSRLAGVSELRSQASRSL